MRSIDDLEAAHAAKLERLRGMDFYDVAAYCSEVLRANGALPLWETPVIEQVRRRRRCAA